MKSRLYIFPLMLAVSMLSSMEVLAQTANGSGDRYLTQKSELPQSGSGDRYLTQKSELPQSGSGTCPLPHAYIDHGDTLPIVALRPYYIYGPTKFKNKQELRRYQKLVNDVKYCLPLAKIAAATMVETTEYMLKYIPDEKDREKHLKKMERELVKEYEPILRKMTYSRGKVLIKLIVRECDSSPYEIIRAYLGNFAAGFWQSVAKLFTADLKVSYDPEGQDRLMEMIAIKVEQGDI